MVRNCKAFAPLISEFVDGALPAGRAWEVQMHLSVCSECAQLAAEMSKTVSMLGRAETLGVSNDFDSRLHTRIAHVGFKRQSAIIRWIKRSVFWPSTRLPRGTWAVVSAPILVGCTLLLATIFSHPNIGPRPTAVESGLSAPEGVFVEACVQNHKSFLSTEPLADPAAQVLANQMDSGVSEDSLAATVSPSPVTDPAEIDQALVGEDL